MPPVKAPRGVDGRFRPGNPGGPGRPRLPSDRLDEVYSLKDEGLSPSEIQAETGLTRGQVNGILNRRAERESGARGDAGALGDESQFDRETLTPEQARRLGLGITGGVGLGLAAIGSPTDEAGAVPRVRGSRAAAAAEQGFNIDQTLFHGTRANFDEFQIRPGDIGVHLGGTPESANARLQHTRPEAPLGFEGPTEWDPLGGAVVRTEPTGEHVLPIHVRADGEGLDLLRVPDMGMEWGKPSLWRSWAEETVRNPFNAHDRRVAQELLDSGIVDTNRLAELLPLDRQPFIDRLQAFFRDRGIRGVTYKNEYEDPGSTSYAIFDPADIRSVNADFDPARSDSRKIMAGLGLATGAGLGLAAIGAPQDAAEAAPNPLRLARSGDAGLGRIAQENLGAPAPSGEHWTIRPENARLVADAYEDMPHAPNDPQVASSYAALKRETLDQFNALREAGYDFDFYPQGRDPYPGGPPDSVADITENRHMSVYPTLGPEGGYGTRPTEIDVYNNPMLEFVPDLEWGGRPVTYNDVFRAVHDAFGHAQSGAGFRAAGEDAAYRTHAEMYSPAAQRAAASELRGQNSWLNYGPYGEQNRGARTEDTVFADQKTGILPDWARAPELHRWGTTDRQGELFDNFEMAPDAPQAAPGGPRRATALALALGMPAAGLGLAAIGSPQDSASAAPISVTTQTLPPPPERPRRFNPIADMMGAPAAIVRGAMNRTARTQAGDSSWMGEDLGSLAAIDRAPVNAAANVVERGINAAAGMPLIDLPEMPGGLDMVLGQANMAVQDPVDYAAELVAGPPARLTADLIRSDAYGDAIEGLFGGNMSPEERAEGRQRLTNFRMPYFESPDNLIQEGLDAAGGRTGFDTAIDLAFLFPTIEGNVAMARGAGSLPGRIGRSLDARREAQNVSTLPRDLGGPTSTLHPAADAARYVQELGLDMPVREEGGFLPRDIPMGDVPAAPLGPADLSRAESGLARRRANRVAETNPGRRGAWWPRRQRAIRTAVQSGDAAEMNAAVDRTLGGFNAGAGDAARAAAAPTAAEDYARAGIDRRRAEIETENSAPLRPVNPALREGIDWKPYIAGGSALAAGAGLTAASEQQPEQVHQLYVHHDIRPNFALGGPGLANDPQPSLYIPSRLPPFGGIARSEAAGAPYPTIENVAGMFNYRADGSGRGVWDSVPMGGETLPAMAGVGNDPRSTSAAPSMAARDAIVAPDERFFPPVAMVTEAERKELQQRLADQGLYTDAIDGVIGPNSQAGINAVYADPMYNLPPPADYGPGTLSDAYRLTIGRPRGDANVRDIQEIIARDPQIAAMLVPPGVEPRRGIDGRYAGRTRGALQAVTGRDYGPTLSRDEANEVLYRHLYGNRNYPELSAVR